MTGEPHDEISIVCRERRCTYSTPSILRFGIHRIIHHGAARELWTGQHITTLWNGDAGGKTLIICWLAILFISTLILTINIHTLLENPRP